MLPFREVPLSAPDTRLRLDPAALAAGLLRLPLLHFGDAELSGIRVARLVYRQLLDESGRWFPLVHVRAPLLKGDRGLIGDSAHQAAGGVLYLQGPAELGDWECRRAGLRLLLLDGGERVEVEPALLRRLAWLDETHMVAVDPSLHRARRSIEAHCRAQGVLLLQGPAGVGKRSLARWAHATQDDQPLQIFRSGEDKRPVPGRWQLFEEVGQLDPAQLGGLRARLRGEAPSSVGGSWEAPVGRPNHPAFSRIAGESAALLAVLDKVDRYAPSGLPMLVLGESGTGKELIARSIHERSGRKGRYVAIDLTSRSETLIESELFGHVKGAFTGAQQDRPGAFREAQGGTLFLDELGNLSLSVQAKLLRALESREVQPVGSDRSFAVDARIVAATNADLERMARMGELREDLLYRFNPAATLSLPPLRDRPDDVLPLAEVYYRLAGGTADPWISAEARALLRAFPWPGNVRELRHVVEAAVVEAAGGLLLPRHLPHLARHRPTPVLLTSSDPPESWALPRDLSRELCSVTLDLPPLHERSSLALRSAILGLLDGRPISAEALSALEHRPWWGNYTELQRAMQALRANLPGAVTLEALQERTPHLATRGGTSPIVVLLFPTLLSNGEVDGLQRLYSEGAVLIGRARALSELQPRGSTRMARRWEALQTALGPATPGCLPLDHLPELSRAHLLVIRDGERLRAHALPDVNLPVFAAPLGEELSRVDPQSSVDIGQGGELQVRSADGGRALVTLYVFAGRVALEDLRGALSRRLRPAEATVGDPEPMRRVWALDDAEQQALIDGIRLALTDSSTFAGGIREASRRALSTRGLERLGAYLDSGHPAQSAARLVGWTANGALRASLRLTLQALPGHNLPKVLQAALEDRLEGAG